jgi:putative DNA primase/helicase
LAHPSPNGTKDVQAHATAEEIFSEPALSRPYPIAVRALRQVAEDGAVPDVSDLDRTDAAAARDFAFLHRDRLCYDNRQGSFRYFDSPVWRLDQIGRALHLLQEHGEDRAVLAICAHAKTDKAKLKAALAQLDARRMKSVLSLVAVQPGFGLVGDEFDREPMLLGVANGVVDLRGSAAIRFRQGWSGDYLSRQTLVPYDPAATCPRFSTFLVETLEDDELIAFVQRWAGYSLTALTREQVFACWIGSGSNGKSVLANVLLALLGTYGITLPFASFTRAAANGSSATPDLAAIPGRRLIVASEAKPTSRFDDARLKALTGEDVIAARPMYGDLFEFQPVAKLLFLFNEAPRVTDLSHGFWRRALLVPFRRQFSESEQDRHLAEKLRQELPGILNWAIAGCLEWQRTGLQPPAAVKGAVDEWREECDLVAEFIGAGCEPAPGEWIAASSFYAAFLGWCAREHVDERDRPARKAFSRRVGSLVERRQRNVGLGFVGLRPRVEVMK